LDYEAWKDRIRQIGGRFDPQDIDPEAFTGWVRPTSVSGLMAAEVGSEAHRVTDGLNWFSAVSARFAMTTIISIPLPTTQCSSLVINDIVIKARRRMSIRTALMSATSIFTSRHGRRWYQHPPIVSAVLPSHTFGLRITVRVYHNHWNDNGRADRLSK
jgi:hypothetical protein